MCRLLLLLLIDVLFYWSLRLAPRCLASTVVLLSKHISIFTNTAFFKLALEGGTAVTECTSQLCFYKVVTLYMVNYTAKLVNSCIKVIKPMSLISMIYFLLQVIMY